jgi:hypothetical protein
LYGLCKTGSLWVLACRGGHRSRRYQRLWPRRGILRLLASFRQSSYWFHRSKPSPFIWSALLVCCLWLVRINCPVIGQNKLFCD